MLIMKTMHAFTYIMDQHYFPYIRLGVDEANQYTYRGVGMSYIVHNLQPTETKQLHVPKSNEKDKNKRPQDILREFECDLDQKRRDLEYAEFSMQVQ